MNSGARSSLSVYLEREMDSMETQTMNLPSVLEEQLSLWKINPNRQPQPIIVPNSNKQVQSNFAFLDPNTDSNIIIFLEDNR